MSIWPIKTEQARCLPNPAFLKKNPNKSKWSVSHGCQWSQSRLKHVTLRDIQHKHTMTDRIVLNGKAPHQNEFVPSQLSCPVRLRAVTIQKGLPTGHLVLCLPCDQALWTITGKWQFRNTAFWRWTSVSTCTAHWKNIYIFLRGIRLSICTWIMMAIEC